MRFNINSTNIHTKHHQPILPLNRLVDHIFVISLPNNGQKQLLSTYFSKYNISFTFVDAIDGFNDKETMRLYEDYSSWTFDDKRTHPLEKKYQTKLILSPGAIALLKSFEKIFELSIKNNYKRIIIFEDDVLFDKDFLIKINEFFRHQKQFDMVYLGASHHVWNNPSIISLGATSYYLAPKVIDGTFATIFSKNVYQPILKKIKQYNGPFDLLVRDINQNKRSYVIYPNICVAETTKTSTISNLSRNLRYHKNKVKWDLSNLDFTRAVLKVSVVIANYNNAQYLEYCLNSIKKQTYKNVEIIFVDDKSTDNSLDVVEKWKQNNTEIDIKIIALEENIGAYAARNKGLQYATGFFVSLLDPDDVFLSTKLELDVYNYFNNPECDIFLSYMYRSQNINMNTFSDEEKLLSEIKIERKKNKINNKYPWNFQFRLGMPTIFVEKTFFDTYGLWKDTFRYGMDIEIIQRYLVKKHKIFMDHQSVFSLCHKLESKNYGIHVSSDMNYVSFPMDDNNATNICSGKIRENIHEECNIDLQNMLKNLQSIDIVPVHDTI